MNPVYGIYTWQFVTTMHKTLTRSSVYLMYYTTQCLLLDCWRLDLMAIVFKEQEYTFHVTILENLRYAVGYSLYVI